MSQLKGKILILVPNDPRVAIGNMNQSLNNFYFPKNQTLSLKPRLKCKICDGETIATYLKQFSSYTDLNNTKEPTALN